MRTKKAQGQSNYRSSDTLIDGSGKVLVYDGSFFGLVCALDHAIKSGDSYEGIRASSNISTKNLFSDEEFVVTDLERAEFFLREVRAISNEIERAIVFSFHSDIDGYEPKLLNFLKYALRIKKFPDDFSNSDVRFIHNLVRRVGCEVHRFKGFLRFMELVDGSLLALYEPDHNITPLLIKHFRERLGNFVWTIFDMKRNYGIKWTTFDFELVFGLDHFKDIGLSSNEKSIQRLWKNYFREIAIKERVNKRLQMQNMPKKYWKYLVEI